MREAMTRLQAFREDAPGKRLRALLFIEKVLRNPTDECVRWPFSVRPNGYGQIGGYAGSRLAHRFVCALAHGEPATAAHEAAHSCGDRLCVNPRHLRWASRSENEADKLAQGTRLRGEGIKTSKLTAQRVQAIREAGATGMAGKEIAAKFDTPLSTVRKVIQRKTWAHV